MTDDELVVERLCEDEEDVVFVLKWAIKLEFVPRNHARRYPNKVLLEYRATGFMQVIRPFQDREGIYHYCE